MPFRALQRGMVLELTAVVGVAMAEPSGAAVEALL